MAGIPRRVFVRPDRLRDFAFLDEHVVQKLETDEEKELAAALIDRDVVIALGGLGGQLGGWAMGLVGRVARILGDASVALGTYPFRAEGNLRKEAADAQLDLLRRKADGVVTFANDRLLQIAPDLPLSRSFAILGSVMGRASIGLATSLSREEKVPFKRFLARSRDWRFGLGAGADKHRAFLAVEEAYKSPWFTGRAEDVRAAVILMGQPDRADVAEEVLHEVRIRSPLADVAWAPLPEPTDGDRVTVLMFAGL
jgi:cell division protein FtsZ